eukprot:GHVT01023436.1.p1 GENE.GHVT01023436.1~~GHVT01023436.1.p1  ORF type:complete len:101 (+),score=6.73 GHVT01023436.1:77-379(+)
MLSREIRWYFFGKMLPGLYSQKLRRINKRVYIMNEGEEVCVNSFDLSELEPNETEKVSRLPTTSFLLALNSNPQLPPRGCRPPPLGSFQRQPINSTCLDF